MIFSIVKPSLFTSGLGLHPRCLDKCNCTWFGISQNTHIFDIGFETVLSLNHIKFLPNFQQVTLILANIQFIPNLSIDSINSFPTLFDLFPIFSRNCLKTMLILSTFAHQNQIADILCVLGYGFCQTLLHFSKYLIDFLPIFLHFVSEFNFPFIERLLHMLCLDLLVQLLCKCAFEIEELGFVHFLH